MKSPSKMSMSEIAQEVSKLDRLDRMNRLKPEQRARRKALDDQFNVFMEAVQRGEEIINPSISEMCPVDFEEGQG